MTDIAIRVEDLSKQYEIGVAKARHDTLRDTLVHFGGRLVKWWRRPDLQPPNGDPSHVWALKDVSFEVKRGQVIGIIGRNGAGKSTLLKILSRITEPTSGRAQIYGRVGSLLEVGTGFDRELTGRENVLLNGAILGMREAEIRRKFDEIVEFAGVEKFIDTPVKRYSSGMYVRLAFAVAAHLEPEILIVDEVLAVGDAAFQQKCLGKIRGVAQEGRTILFVSHNTAAVRNLCSRGILLMNGRVALAGATEDVVQRYLSTFESSHPEGPTLEERTDRSGDGTVRVVAFEARVSGTQNGAPPRTGAPADFIIEYKVREDPVPQLYAGIIITDIYGVDIMMCSTSMSNSNFLAVSGRGRLVCHLDYLPLKPGTYSISIKLLQYLGMEYQKADEVISAAKFEVVEGGDSGFREYGKAPVVVPHRWLLSSDGPSRRDIDLPVCRTNVGDN
jgi:lipopolysaccharide transport system ATP-binding protein